MVPCNMMTMDSQHATAGCCTFMHMQTTNSGHALVRCQLTAYRAARALPQPNAAPLHHTRMYTHRWLQPLRWQLPSMSITHRKPCEPHTCRQATVALCITSTSQTLCIQHTVPLLVPYSYSRRLQQ
jgi:hypothetical protein